MLRFRNKLLRHLKRAKTDIDCGDFVKAHYGKNNKYRWRIEALLYDMVDKKYIECEKQQILGTQYIHDFIHVNRPQQLRLRIKEAGEEKLDEIFRW